jgi:hypothetical protein
MQGAPAPDHIVAGQQLPMGVRGQMPEKRAPRPPDRAGFDQLARAIHASYLSRWDRHDPKGLKRATQLAESLKEQSEERTPAA